MSKPRSFSKKQVEHIANLVRLTLTEAERIKFANEMGQTLGYIENLDELDTRGVAPTYQTTGQKNRFHAGDPDERTLNRDDALQNAPKKKNGYFQIKGFEYGK